MQWNHARSETGDTARSVGGRLSGAADTGAPRHSHRPSASRAAGAEVSLIDAIAAEVAPPRASPGRHDRALAAALLKEAFRDLERSLQRHPRRSPLHGAQP